MSPKETTIVSVGDFVDVYHKIKQKGIGKILASFNLNSNKRVSGKWDTYTTTSDFWVIPELTQYWNKKISGNPNMVYEDYVAEKYLKDKKGLKMLSIGCGEGIHERNFAKYNYFSQITGVDLAEKSVQKAIETAKNENLDISYFAEDFRKSNLENNSFDIILFNASLHHFSDLTDFLSNEIKPLLKEEGYLVINEFCGPNRLQWTNSQLKKANDLLKKLPPQYTTLVDGTSTKKKVYRPGLIRMFLVDPSEAPDSANLVAALRDNFKVLEETKLGGTVLHMLLKGIAHNFLNDREETKVLLDKLIHEENTFQEETNTTDFIFGVYQKSKS